MNAALRLINLAVVMLVALSSGREMQSATVSSAEAAGRWIGALLLIAMPLLAGLGLAHDAARSLRTAAIRMGWTMLVIFIVVGTVGSIRLFGASGTSGLTAAVLGLVTFTALCALNLWTLRRLRRQQEAGEKEDAERSLIRYWRGELPLGVTFWAGGITILLLQLVLVAGIGLSTQVLPMRAGAVLFLLAVGIGLSLLWVQTLIVWRSATRRSREDGGPWSLLARSAVIAMTLVFSSSLGTVWRPALHENILIALGRDPLQPLEVSITTGGSVLLLHGTFGTGSAERVRRLLTATPSVKTIALVSNGGRLREAAQIADLVRERRLDTYVDTRCESACTFVFLAGKDRAATPNARLGFHRPSLAGATASALGPATEGMLRIYREAGIPQAFLERVASTDSDDMWYPSSRELEEAGVINRVSLGGEISAIGFVKGTSRPELEAAFRELPMMLALEKHFPGTIEEAVQAAWLERNQGGVDAAVSSAARTVVAERYPRILAAADDDSLDEFATIMIGQFRAARAISVEACGKLLAGELNISQVLSPSLVRRELDWALAALSVPRLVARAPVDDAQFRHHMAEATSVLTAEDLDVISDLGGSTHPPERQCDATIALYERIGKLPDAQRHLLLRGMFQEGAL